MRSTNIIRPGDTIVVTIPLALHPGRFEEGLNKLFPGVKTQAMPVRQEDIVIVAHYRPGTD